MPAFWFRRRKRFRAKSFRQWMKSSFSYHNGNCVEVAGLGGGAISVRNSRDPRGAVLTFTPAEWDAFIGGVRLGEFDRKR
jgi:hypothetical protein